MLLKTNSRKNVCQKIFAKKVLAQILGTNIFFVKEKKIKQIFDKNFFGQQIFFNQTLACKNFIAKKLLVLKFLWFK